MKENLAKKLTGFNNKHLAISTTSSYNVYMSLNLKNKGSITSFTTLIVLLIFFTTLSTDLTYAKEEAVKEETTDTNPKYVSENIRARLPEARKCTKENSGNSWGDCRYGCVEICNEIVDTYSRGVCNGALIQICCGQHPSGCK